MRRAIALLLSVALGTCQALGVSPYRFGGMDPDTLLYTAEGVDEITNAVVSEADDGFLSVSNLVGSVESSLSDRIDSVSSNLSARVDDLSVSVTNDMGLASTNWVLGLGYVDESVTNGLAAKSYVDYTSNYLESWVLGKKYVTESVTNGLASTNWVLGLGYVGESVTNGLASTNWVLGLGYVGESVTNGLASTNWVLDAISEFDPHIDSSITNGLASTNWVLGLGYVGESVTNGLATTEYASDEASAVRDWVSGMNYVTESVTNGLASTNWVASNDYATRRYVDDAFRHSTNGIVTDSVISLYGDPAIFLTATNGPSEEYVAIRTSGIEVSNDTAFVTIEYPRASGRMTTEEWVAGEFGIRSDGTNTYLFANGSSVCSVIRNQNGFVGLSMNSTGGVMAVSEGTGTASGDCSHAEGYRTRATGGGAHAEGNDTVAAGAYSHAEGYLSETSSTAWGSHAEGRETVASGINSHAEGYQSVVSGRHSHAEGRASKAYGDECHAEGYGSTASSTAAHAEGYSVTASGEYSHAEGNGTTASSTASHAEGYASRASGQYSHAEGAGTSASGYASHSEGESSTASGRYSHAGGFACTASGDWSFASGSMSSASGVGSIALGTGIESSGTFSTAIGTNCVSSGRGSVAIGAEAVATDNGVAIGTKVSAPVQSTVIGHYNYFDGRGILGGGASVIGCYNSVTGAMSFVAGSYNGIGRTAYAVGSFNMNSNGWFSVLIGDDNRTVGDIERGVAIGCNNILRHSNSFVWGGSYESGAEYWSHGTKTFNVNPSGGADGFYIGHSRLSDLFVPRAALNAALANVSTNLPATDEECRKTLQDLIIALKSL